MEGGNDHDLRTLDAVNINDESTSKSSSEKVDSKSSNGENDSKTSNNKVSHPCICI